MGQDLERESSGLAIQAPWVQILAPPLGCMISGKNYKLLIPYFLHLQDQGNKSPYSRGLLGFKRENTYYVLSVMYRYMSIHLVICKMCKS